ncbi:MAG: type II toxin-antitoxin system HicB family antitoxin [bacterium]|nr:type II toxin-antitoxin system HicB family antitoxin [bacterium]
MKTKVLNYRIIITPDTQTGTGKSGFTAFCPTLDVADDGDTAEEALENVKKAIQCYTDSLVEDKVTVPVDHLQQDNASVTTTQCTTTL